MPWRFQISILKCLFLSQRWFARKFSQHHYPRLQKVHFRLAFVAQKRRFLSSLQLACLRYRSELALISRQHKSTNDHFHYPFKIFLSFWLAQISRKIFHNQLALTKFGRRLRYVEKNVNSSAIIVRKMDWLPRSLGDEVASFDAVVQNSWTTA